MKKTLLLFISAFAIFANALNAEELIRYSDNGNILERYQCDKIAVHESSNQDTLICAKRPKVALNTQFRKILTNADYQNCSQNSDCVVIENNRDPNWSPVALYGIPDAFFGRHAKGRSCVRIQETVPNSTTWAKENWRLCTNNPNIELAYTYALGHPNEGVDRRFKKASTKRACFDRVLKGYQHRRFWTDNCIFVRYK